MRADANKLSWMEKVGYALGDTASNFYWKTFEFFLQFFYTDVFGIPATTVATLFIVNRAWDAITDVGMGALADRTRTRWGRFRPYLLWCAIPTAVAGVLTVNTPKLDTDGKILWAYATYMLMMMVYTAINIPYSALLGVMTSDTEERTSLSSIRFIGAFTGAVIVQYSTLKLVKFFGRGDDARGWQLTLVVWGIIAASLFVVSFATTKERVEPPREQTPDLKGELGELVRNSPWMVMFALGILTLTAFITRGSSTMYYFKYYVGDEELAGTFLTLGGLAGLAGVALTAPLTKWFGKKKLYVVLMWVAGVLTLAFHFVPPEQTTLIIALHVLISFILGPNAALVWSMYADTADYGEWKNKRRSTGLVFSAATFSQKMGGAVAGGLSGLLLAWFGYVPNQPQTAQAMMGIRFMMSILPGILCIAAGLVMLAYKLDDDTMKNIESELAQRRSSSIPQLSSLDDSPAASPACPSSAS